MSIALFDCRVPERIAREIGFLLQSGRLTVGPAITTLEARLAHYVGGRPVVTMSDMTQALAMALRLAGVGPGDEVGTLALNCMSSNTAIAMVGASPVWIDIDPDTASIDLSDLELCLSGRIRAVVAYHLAGYVGDLDALRVLCTNAGVPLIEDANNALGAEWRGSRAGTFGDYAIFSFYANRQLNGIDGAALVCPDDNTAARAKRLRRFGIDTLRFRSADGEIDATVDVPEIGVAAALANVNAMLACLAMDDLDVRLDRNRSNVRRLSAALADVSTVRFVGERDGARGVFWAALVRCAARDGLMSNLKAKGIQCSKLHQRNDYYSGFDVRHRPLPGTSTLEREMFAIPSGWWLSPDDLDRIAEEVRAAAGRS